MSSLALLLRFVLAAVFAAAGAAKLMDMAGSRRALAGFGVPESLRPAVAWLLPLAELATAVALIFRPTARWGALAALILLLLFIVGIARAMSRGEAPDCHCFGQLHSAPAGRATLLRNVLLAGAAGFIVIYGPGPSINAWIDARSAGELAATGLGIVALLSVAMCVRLWIENRNLRDDLAHERDALALFPPGLPVGAAAPDFVATDLRGEETSLRKLLDRGKPVALVFVSPHCGPCAALLPELGEWQPPLRDRLTIGVISSGTAQDNWRAREHGLNALLQTGTEVMEAYRVRATPSVVVVTPDRRVASSVAVGASAVEPLIRVALRHSDRVPIPSNGASAGQPYVPG